MDYWAQREHDAYVFPPALLHRMASMRGPGSSNILIPDFLLQGPHPGSSTPEIVSFLKPLLQAGVTTFVCLQGELPTSATSGQGSRSATFGSGGAISAKPYFEGALAMVRAGGYPLSATPERLSFVHYPMPATPGCVPEAGLLKQVVLDVLAFCAAGEYVYLHCSDGNGRSGTVAAAVLALAYGLGPTEALEHLATSRRHRHGSAGASPETHEQRMAVHKLLTVAPPAAAQTLPTHTRARPGSAAPQQQQPQPQQQQPAAAGLITASERAAITAAMAHGASRARSEFARHSDGASALSAAALRSLQGKLAALNSQRGGAYALASCKRAVVERLAGTALLPVPVPAVLGGRVCGRVARGGLGAVGEACGWFLTGEEEETLWRACLEVEGREGGGVEDEVGGEGGGAIPPPSAQQAPASYGRGGRSSGGGGAGSGAAAASSTPRLPTASGPSVCLSTLFRVARGALSPAELPAPRLASITGAWERLWKAAYGSTEGSSSSGAQAVLPLATLAAVFSPATHPEVRANMRSAEAAQGDFLEAFALRRRAGSSSVGKGEFFAFYADVCHATPDESMFHSLMEGCWPAPHVVGSGGGSGYAGAGAQLPVAPGGLRGSSAQASAPPSIFLAAQAQAAAPEEVLRAHLARVCDASLPYLLYACRAADTDSDGCLRLEEWRCALQDTILHCTDAGGQLAHSAAPVGGEVFLRSRAAAVASGGQQPQGGALLGQGLHHMSAQLHPLLLTDTDATFIFNHLLSRCTRSSGQQQQRSRQAQAQAQLLLPFAEACEVLRGPAASKPSRAALIASLYATLDSRKEGRVGMAAATAAFNAAAHPRCVAGRTNPALYSRIFRDSFVEGGQLVEARGGESSRRLMGGPAGEAYYGSGDAGFVKESFFTEWCAGLSASYASPGEDGDFALTVSSLWSGKQLSRGGGAGLPVSAAASKCLENEEDLADIMGRMGSRGGPGARWSSAQVQGGGAASSSSSSSSSSAMANPSSSPVRCSFAKEQRIGGEGRSKSMSGLLPGPASTAKTGQLRGAGLEASLSPARGGGGAPYLPSPASSMAASGSYSTSSASAAAAASGAPPSHYSAPSSAFCVNYPPTVQPILSEVMAVLQRRGVKASFRLLAALERVSGQTAQQQYPISLCEPAPISAVFACLRDAGCALDGGKLGALSQAFACDESASGVLCIPWEVLSAVHGGGLKGGRAAVVDKAWARICVQTAQGWGESPAGGQGIPTLADVRVLAEGLDESKRKVETGAGYAAHPDVKSGRRTAEDVEKEFLETFSGPTIVNGERGQDEESDLCTRQGFHAFYTLHSAHHSTDSSFVSLLFDTWRLHNVGDDGHSGSRSFTQRAGVVRSGDQQQLPQRNERSVAVLMGGTAPAYRYSARGPGPEGMPAEYYASVLAGGDALVASQGSGAAGSVRASAPAPSSDRQQLPLRNERSVAVLMGGPAPAYRYSVRGPGTEGMPSEYYANVLAGGDTLVSSQGAAGAGSRQQGMSSLLGGGYESGQQGGRRR